MIMIGVLGVAAAVSFSSIPRSRQVAAAMQLQRDLTYARERAMATGLRHWVVFSIGSNSYSILSEDPLNPGRTGALTITDPATQAPFVQRLNAEEFAGAALDSVYFDTQGEVGFTWLGEPLNSEEAALAATGVVQLTGDHQLNVQSGTGMVTYDPP